MPELDDSERLLRRVHPHHVNDGGNLMWVAFRDRELSVDREALRPLIALRSAFPTHTFARLVVGSCRGAGFDIRIDPLPDNSAHALVISPGASHGELRRFAMILRDLAEWPAT